MKRTSLTGILLHVAVAIGFAVLAAVWSFPLVAHLSSHIPGGGIGDNAMFLWNFWWMRTALASGTGFLHTTHLFAPVGADLTLHTHTALPAFVGATVLRNLSVVAALNLTTLASLALNGFCTYLLAWRVVRQRGAAVLAGIIFATSPYIAAHLNGHFNLTTAWTIPLFALGIWDAGRGSVRWALLTGLALAATAYIDYYYVIYEIVFAGVVLLLDARRWSVEWGPRPPSTRWPFVLVGAAVAVDLVLLVAIRLTGGFVGQLGRIRFSVRETFNPLQLLWLLIAIALWIRLRPQVTARQRDGWSWGRAIRALAVTLGIFLVLSVPLLRHGAGLLVRGEYVTQQYYWRSAPVGIDLSTIFLGNPFHSLWGSAVRQLYARIGIALIESGAWLGITPLVLAVHAARRGGPVVHQWAALGCVFFVWALGSHVHLAGYNTGLIMPEVLLRYVPIAANARVPGRAMVVVYLAIAVLAAMSVAHFRWRRSAAAVSAIAVLVLADYFVAPLPLASIECPAIYTVLKDRQERGALVELPLGVRDGFGELTLMDHHMLVCQTIHERPLVGGALARLPGNVLGTYRSDPLLAAWLRLSSAHTDVVPPAEGVPDSTLAGQRMKADNIAFVMLNRRTASAQLREYVEHVLPVRLIAEDAERALYLSSQ